MNKSISIADIYSNYRDDYPSPKTTNKDKIKITEKESLNSSFAMKSSSEIST
jgi:hypothetical protein